MANDRLAGHDNHRLAEHEKDRAGEISIDQNGGNNKEDGTKGRETEGIVAKGLGIARAKGMKSMLTRGATFLRPREYKGR